MPLSATIPVGTLATGVTCFIGQEHSFIDRVLRPVYQHLEPLEVMKTATGVVALTSRRLRLGNDIKPKERSRAILLLVGIAEYCRL